MRYLSDKHFSEFLPIQEGGKNQLEQTTGTSLTPYI